MKTAGRAFSEARKPTSRRLQRASQRSRSSRRRRARPRRDQRGGELVDLGVMPGMCSWVLWRFEAGGEYPMHHTDTLDFDVVLGGSVELLLDDGPHLLRPGDCVVMTGVDHSWRAGGQGCLISGVAFGSERTS